jgi:hypothetical protein
LPGAPGAQRFHKTKPCSTAASKSADRRIEKNEAAYSERRFRKTKPLFYKGVD